MERQKINIAIIDLYNNEKNEGMRCIREIAAGSSKENIEINYDVFETRYKNVIPDLSYDIYISSGGPGSPFEGEGSEWEEKYFNLIDDVAINNKSGENKKYFFFICHSFQLMARYFRFAKVSKREKKSFGVLPVELTEDGKNDPMLAGLKDVFYAADFREWQVVNPDKKILSELGASILAVEVDPKKEKEDLALMAVRISPEIAGTQFHPEADPESMMYHFKQDERKKFVVDNFGEEKYYEMISLLDQEDKIKHTRKTVLPSFLNSAIENLSLTLTKEMNASRASAKI